jgi:hypothetical protein
MISIRFRIEVTELTIEWSYEEAEKVSDKKRRMEGSGQQSHFTASLQ